MVGYAVETGLTCRLIRRFMLAVIFIFQINILCAQTNIDSLEVVIKGLTGTTQIDAINELAYKLISKDLNRMRLLADSTYYLSRSLGYGRGEITSLYFKGIYFDISGGQDSSAVYFKKGLEMSQKAGLKDLEANGLNNLGMLNWNKENYQNALDYFLKALNLYELLGNESGISKATSNIGLIYQELNQYRQALDYNFKALALRQKYSNNSHLSKSHNNIGICYLNLQEHDSALLHFNISLKYAEIDHLKQDQVKVHSNLANLFYEQGNFSQAIEAMTTAIRMREEFGTPRADNYNNMAKYYNALGDYRSALKFGLFADSLLNHKIEGSSVELIHTIGTAYLGLGQTAKGLSFMKTWKSKYDSLFSGRIAHSVSELKEKYESEKKEQEIQFLKAEKEVNELKLAQQELFILIVFLIAIAIVSLIWYISRNRRLHQQMAFAEERQALQNERYRLVLETEEKERTRVARELHDGIGQMLSTVRLFVSDMGERSENPKVERSLNALDETIDEVRRISHNMMPQVLLKEGLIKAIKDLTDKINATGQLRIEIHHPDQLKLNEFQSLAVYRTVQEIFNNAIKYAHATAITIHISENNGSFDLSISDNGTGFKTEEIAKSKGIGWSNIFSRMELIGGKLSIDSEQGRGTNVILNIPVSLD